MILILLAHQLYAIYIHLRKILLPITEDIPLTNPFEGIGNLKEAADALMEFLLIVGFVVGPILIIYAGFLLLTKQGEPAAITQAKQIILWTIISLSIMLFAKGVPSVVKDIFK